MTDKPGKLNVIMTHSNKIMLHRPIGKKINIGISILAMIMIGLSACESQPIKRVDLRQGMDYRELLEAYGTPLSQSYEKQTELTHYSWKLSSSRLEITRRSGGTSTVSRDGKITTGSASQQETTVIPIYCYLTVMVNQQNKVANWDSKGTGCRQILYNQL